MTGRPTTVRVAAGNVPHDLDEDEAGDDSTLLMDAAGPRGAVLACEIDHGNDGPFEAAAHAAGKRALFRDRRTQVAIPTGWRDYERLHYRLSARVPFNPARDANVVFDHATGTAYVAVHLTNGKGRRQRSDWRRRLRLWNRQEARLRALVHRLHYGGWNLVLGGDLNDTHGGVRVHPRQVTCAHHGLMWLVAVPAPDFRVTHGPEHVEKRNNGDHPQVSADITFTPRRTR